MDSDSAPIEQTFEQAKSVQNQRNKQITKHLEVQKEIKKQKREKVKQNVNHKRKKISNLFEDQNDTNLSSNNVSQFTIVQQKFDQSFQRNLDERLPKNISKQLTGQLKFDLNPVMEPEIINKGEAHIIKKLSNNITAEEIKQKWTNPKENAKSALLFLKKNIFDKYSKQRKIIKSIIRK